MRMTDSWLASGWFPSLVLLFGIAFFFGMLWIAIHSQRFRQVVREEEGLDPDEEEQR
jgi:hypothetical protein